MKPVLEWTVADGKHRETANVGALLWLEVSPNEERQEWDWFAYDLQGLELATGTDDGRGAEHAKAQAEAFARRWIKEQAAALNPDPDPLAKLEEMNCRICCSNDAEVLFLMLARDGAYIYEDVSTQRCGSSATITELREAAARLLAKIGLEPKP